MSSKARKKHKRDVAAGRINFKVSKGEPIQGLLEVHRAGEKVQRIEFNFGQVLAQYGATLYGVDFAPDRVILHCQPGSQEAFELANVKLVENLVDTGAIRSQDCARPETLPQGTPS